MSRDCLPYSSFRIRAAPPGEARRNVSFSSPIRIVSFGIVRKIREGLGCLEGAMRNGEVGVYTLQAAIAAEHARAETPEEDELAAYSSATTISCCPAHSSPIAELNRAVAVAMVEGAETRTAAR